MDGAICADCTTLYVAALEAIIRHNRAQSRLALAKLQRDFPKIKVLEPVVEHLFQERRAAVRAYQQHIDTHAKEATSGTMT